MVKPDWNIFKSKFSDNPQTNFEWLCYLLFCNEHRKTTGIFRYKNQSAIETDPVTFQGKLIGWQAKFYDTALSAHKTEMLNILKKAKRDYPDINKLYLFTNKEWGQYRGKEPAGKRDIDQKAKELLIELEWRCGSYFESPFVVDENARIVSHFFRESDDIYELLKSLSLHTENIFSNIETEIIYNDQKVVIDRSDLQSEIKTTTKQVVILSGDGGTGKTSLIKSLYTDKHPDAAFYIHKATEFSVNRIDDLLSGVSLNDFLNAHQGACSKIVVIDSAENLLGLDNIDPFREYISALLEGEWKIWLTTRNNYLNDLRFQFQESYKITYKSVNLPSLTLNELSALSNRFSFQLPNDRRLRNLITVPFYLSRYLNHHHESKSLNYAEFKNSLWIGVITKSSPQREQAFIELAVDRANSGQFFVQFGSDGATNQVESSLTNDGLISYESPHGYFITHDIYEEWALEKHLEAKFLISERATVFFTEIKQSLPVRRAFRKWISVKLGDQEHGIVHFIRDSLSQSSDEIPKLWTDDILISILLSNNSAFFFTSYKDRLLDNDCSLLKQICLLIRLGCKEVDSSLFENIGLTAPDFLSMEYVFTKPIGNGWESLIKFIYENYSSIREQNCLFILPIIHDWNASNKTGKTTRYASLLALKYYEWVITENIYTRDDDTGRNLILTILYGVREISKELSQLIDQIIENKWNKHNDPYNLLSQFILSKLECFGVANALPEKVISLAKLFWTYEPSKNDIYSAHPSSDVDHYFGITHDFRHYHPSSAYQTPIYNLLKTDLKLTLDFIIEFTNVATEKYASSSLDKNEVETVTVILNEGKTIRQYISNRLWCLYRGTQVNPSILESIHMSLERFLLERGKAYSSQYLETMLHYILSRTNSAALSSLVTSIVLAFHEKTFQVAQILFKTKEFYLYDTKRLLLDQNHKSQLITLKNSFGIDRMNEIHENERISACDAKHRKFSLEDIMRQYQFFRDNETSEEVAKGRLDEIWKTLDAFYEKLPAKDNETQADKTWRLYLARMDKRKMSPEVKESKDGFVIEFNPEIDSELKEHSENVVEEAIETNKHSQLYVWSEKRLYDRDDYQKYDKYEANPLTALHETKELWSEIKEGGESASSFLNRSIPPTVCAVLLRDFHEKMDRDDLEFCKEVVFYYGSLFLQSGYYYQVSDGVLPSLSVLPILVRDFPEEEEIIKFLMIMALMRNDPIDSGITRFNTVVINALQPLWKKDFDFALSIYIGYIVLAQKWNDILSEYRKVAYESGQFNLDLEKFMSDFLEDSSEIFEQIADESINNHVVEDINSVDINILSTAFQTTPLKTECVNDIPYLKELIPIISEKILSNDRDEKIDYTTRHLFYKKYTQYVLHLELNEIGDYLTPFTDNFVIGEDIAKLFEEFINSEDYANRPDHFWVVWGLFKEKVFDASASGKGRHYSSRIVESYMFAHNSWKEDAKNWHTFSEDRKTFFCELTLQTGGRCSLSVQLIEVTMRSGQYLYR